MSSKSEAGLGGLSEELVERIFSHLAPRDIMSTSLVCRSFSRISEPFLYRNMVIGALDGRGQRSIRALLDRPQHTSSVREATIYTSESQLGVMSLSTFTDRQQETLGQWTPLHRQLNRYIDVVGRVVQQMTSLESLEVRFLRHSNLQELLHCVFRNYGKIGDPAKMFPRLATLRFRPVDLDEEEFVRLRTAAMEPIFSLPRIEEFELQNIQFEGDPRTETWVSPAPTLKTLVLRECPVKPHHLASLIQTCPSLQTLDCEIMYDAEYAHSTGAYDFSEIGHALGVLKDTLQSLRLIIILFTTTAIDIGNPGPWGIQASMGHTLKAFSRLTKLEISLPVLLGWHARGTPSLTDVLPESLEELFVTQEPAYWDGYEWNDLGFSEEPDYIAVSSKIRDYLDTRPKKLRKITVAVADMDDEEAMAFTQAVVEKGAEAGVQIETVQERYT
ncbi:hypothetical protein SLS57_003151 [Botryosphaeria dothidea]